jgi:hypothetical protein
MPVTVPEALVERFKVAGFTEPATAAPAPAEEPERVPRRRRKSTTDE